VVLVNSNPASIHEHGSGDGGSHLQFEPLTPDVVRQVIELGSPRCPAAHHGPARPP